MKLRPPTVPLITVDPYFSVWSMSDSLNSDVTRHWTGKPNPITGMAVIDGKKALFMGKQDDIKPMRQTGLHVDALSTYYTFEAAGIELKLKFTASLIPDDLPLLSRPVSYLELSAVSLDAKPHHIDVNIMVGDEICLNEKGEKETETCEVILPVDAACMKMGAKDQQVLCQSGDDIRINWGYFYLAVKGAAQNVSAISEGRSNLICASCEMNTEENSHALILFAYDDIYSIEYFHEKLQAFWKKDGLKIEDALAKAILEYESVINKCRSFSEKLYHDALKTGGEKYAELTALAYRQAVAAHKLVCDKEGNILFISKECFSNGCAATVDVTYPSAPLFLLYNPELLKGMLRPVFRYANSSVWPFDFAPHDAGQYPLLNGQVYSGGTDPESQMPVEECGNMLILCAAIAVAEKDASFVRENIELIKKWACYLEEHGLDPERQLCTDDFAERIEHNCNLSIKAIMALASYSIICAKLGDRQSAEKYDVLSRDMAAKWAEMASNGDGSTKLAFHLPDTYSMKYNIIWDMLFHTGLFPDTLFQSEFKSYFRHFNRYGLPLDNRKNYTKSDWLIWCASLTDNKADFEAFIEPLWKAYNESESRVPLTDWYDTETAKQIAFQNRTVVGGYFVKLLKESGKMKL